jgi:multiple sugar transport system ATP-binding protein
MRHVLKADIDSRVRRAASVLGIEAFLSRRPAELSGGQRQRVALGRALVRDPQVFLWDEPLSNLDAQLRDQMRTELVKLQRQLETTTIHVTHDQVEAMMMAQRIAVMREGRLQQIGPPLDVYNAPANRFVAEFIGSPPMNFRTGTLAKTGDDLGVRFSEFIVPLPPDRLPTLQRWAGRDVTLGIRPEHITTVRPTGQELPSLRAEVVLAQSVGAETFLDLRCGDWEFTVRSDSRHTYRSQELIDIYVSPSQCHLFDPASGKAL